MTMKARVMRGLAHGRSRRGDEGVLGADARGPDAGKILPPPHRGRNDPLPGSDGSLLFLSPQLCERDGEFVVFDPALKIEREKFIQALRRLHAGVFGQQQRGDQCAIDLDADSLPAVISMCERVSLHTSNCTCAFAPRSARPETEEIDKYGVPGTPHTRLHLQTPLKTEATGGAVAFPTFHLGRVLDPMFLRVELRQGTDAAPARDESLPKTGDVQPERTHRAHAGYHHLNSSVTHGSVSRDTPYRPDRPT